MDEIIVLEEIPFSVGHKRGLHHERGDRLRLWGQQQGRCWWCKRQCRLDGDPEDDYWNVDHVIPLSHWGTNHWRNLVGSCYKCNEERDLRWREIKIRWVKPPEPDIETSSFSLGDKMRILKELEFLPAKEAA